MRRDCKCVVAYAVLTRRGGRSGPEGLISREKMKQQRSIQFAVVQQLRSQLQPFVFVDVEDNDGGSTGRRDTNDPGILESKVFKPILCAGVEQCDDFA